MDKAKIHDIQQEEVRVKMLSDMLHTNIDIFCSFEGQAGVYYAKNRNASKTAILNQITTLRNELLVLAECFKE